MLKKVLVFVVCIAFFTGATSCKGTAQSPAATVRALFDAVNTGSVDRAAEYWAPGLSDFRSMDWGMSIASGKTIGKIKSVQIKGENVRGDNAEVYIKVEVDDSFLKDWPVYYMRFWGDRTFVLIKYGKEWKIFDWR